MNEEKQAEMIETSKYFFKKYLDIAEKYKLGNRLDLISQAKLDPLFREYHFALDSLEAE